MFGEIGYPPINRCKISAAFAFFLHLLFHEGRKHAGSLVAVDRRFSGPCGTSSENNGSSGSRQRTPRDTNDANVVRTRKCPRKLDIAVDNVFYGVPDFAVHARHDRLNEELTVPGRGGKKTNGRIKSILEPGLAPSLVAANAFVFKDCWKSPFDESNTTNKSFTRVDGSKVERPTMSVTADTIGYRTSGRFVAIELPYIDEDFALTLVTPPPQRGRILRIEADHLVQVGNRAIGVAFLTIGFTAPSECKCRLRIEADRLVQVGNRAIVVAFLTIGFTAPSECKCRLRIDADRLVQVGNRAIVVAFLTISLVEAALTFDARLMQTSQPAADQLG
jgi:Serpin (serine protease inhibitor)